MIKKLDDIVHRIIVQRATPDWLPFLPGSSFWVPPRRDPFKFTDLVDKLTDRLTDEESLALSSDRGWPCAHLLVNRIGSEPARLDDEEGSRDTEVDEEVEIVAVDYRISVTENVAPFTGSRAPVATTWTPPQGLLKLNADATVSKNHPSAGSSGVICNSDGEVVAAVAPSLAGGGDVAILEEKSLLFPLH
uniref:Uncharacterized protein n=1 Tax=Cannabis sativa TaxID=3483 RepID=A0A803Q839_CANSA